MTESSSNVIQRILDWLRGGYPQGVPRQDYVALLGILHRSLTEAEVAEVAESLASTSQQDGQAVTREQIAELIKSTVYEQASEADITRVSSRLAAAGWPLAFGAEIAPRPASSSDPSAAPRSASSSDPRSTTSPGTDDSATAAAGTSIGSGAASH